MAAHKYWRLWPTTTDGGSTLTVAGIELRTSAGGANQATAPVTPTIVDKSGSARSLTVTSVALSRSVKSLGERSGLFNTSANGISMASSSDLDMGTGDWAIGMRVCINSLAQADNVLIAVNQASYGASSCLIDLFSSGKVALSAGSGGLLLQSTTVLAIGSFYDIEVSKISGTIRLFVNGNLDASASDSNSWSFSNGVGMTVGYANWAPTVSRIPGYIDELYVMKGAGRHSAAYTPATTQIDSSDPQWSNIKLLINFEAINNEVEASSGTATNAFDGNNATNWAVSSGTTGYVQYCFDPAKDIVEHAVTAPSSSTTNSPKDWSMYYSDDGATWYPASTVASQTSWSSNQQRVFTHSTYTPVTTKMRSSQVVVEVIRSSAVVANRRPVVCSST